MQKWEYKELLVGSARYAAYHLKSQGEEGWELVQILPVGCGTPQGDHSLIFKRPLVEKPKDPQTG